MQDIPKKNCVGSYTELLVCSGVYCVDGNTQANQEEAAKFLNQAKGNLEVYFVRSECELPVVKSISGYVTGNVSIVVPIAVVIVWLIMKATKLIRL